MQVLHFIVCHCQSNKIWLKMAQVLTHSAKCAIDPPSHWNRLCDFFFLWSFVINSFECVWQWFLQLQRSIMGNRCIGYHVSWALPLSIYIVCHHLQSMAQCATCSHVVSLCMIWEKEARMWFAFSTSRGHLGDQHLTLAIFNREIMDLECLGK